MKKIKFFTSLLRERDWLEEMATQGWLLQNMTLGIIYDFKAIEPCEKVYEIENFALSHNPAVSDLSSRINAISMAKEFGWEVATHDEMLNFYFVKDKAGDETDEFYSDEEDRKARAERFRNRNFDLIPGFWKSDLILAIFYSIILIAFNILCYYVKKPNWGFIATCVLFGIYLFNSIITNLSSLSSLKHGRLWSKELCMSRAEWESYKQHSEETSISTLPQLRSYLEEKNKAGLILTGYENSTFHFEDAIHQCDYVLDTQSDLVERLKEKGSPFVEISKNWFGNSPKWYEASIALATEHNLIPVAVVNRNILVYKRPHSEEPLPWENKHKRAIGPLPRKSIMIILIIFFLICVIFGFTLGREFGRMLKDTLPNL